MKRIFNRLMPLARGLLAPEGTPYPELVELARAFETTPPHGVLFGDSSVERVAREDRDRRSLGRIVADQLAPVCRLHTLTHSAYTARLYVPFLRAMRVRGWRPSWVVVPVNLRSFSPQWFLHPHWQFEPEQRALEACARDRSAPLPRVAALDPETVPLEAYDRHVLPPLPSPLRTLGEFRRLAAQKMRDDKTRSERLRDLFLLHYACPIEDTHPLLSALRDATAEVAAMGTKALFYVVPINVDAAMAYAGDKLAAALAANLRVVVSSLEDSAGKAGVFVMDWSRYLRRGEFFHPDCLTEHYNEKGRLNLGAQLAEQIKTLFVCPDVSMLRVTRT